MSDDKLRLARTALDQFRAEQQARDAKLLLSALTSALEALGELGVKMGTLEAALHAKRLAEAHASVASAEMGALMARLGVFSTKGATR